MRFQGLAGAKMLALRIEIGRAMCTKDASSFQKSEEARKQFLPGISRSQPFPVNVLLDL